VTIFGPVGHFSWHSCSTPGLPGWSFLGQISEIWPRFKLVGLKRIIWSSGSFWPHLKLVGLKRFVCRFGFLVFLR